MATAPATSPIVLDDTKKKIAMVVAAVGVLGGGGLLALTWVYDWGFLGWFWGGGITLLFMIGLISTVARKSQFASAACPSCSATMTFIEPDDHRILQCEACGEWSEGTDVMRPVGDDYVAETPTFTAPVGKDRPIAWVEDEAGAPICSLCGGPAEMKPTEAVEYSLTLALGGPGTKTTWSVKAPTCSEHPNALALVARPEGGAAVAFRSRAYQKQFAALNAPAEGEE